MKYIKKQCSLKQRLAMVLTEYMEIHGYNAIAIMSTLEEDGSTTVELIGGNKEIKR